MTDTVWIRSTIDPRTQKAACLLNWGHVTEVLLTPEVVLTTARDLMAAAAHAEADVAFLAYCRETLKVDITTAGYMLRDIRAGRPAPTGKTALRIEAVAGAKTGKALVHIARGALKGELTPDTAREMAATWTEAAMAAQIDVRLRYVLGDYPQLNPADVEEIFGKLLSVQR